MAVDAAYQDFMNTLIGNHRWTFLSERARAQGFSLPHYEFSLYGETSLATWLMLPPMLGFNTKVQCRLGNFAHWNARPDSEHVRRSSTGTLEQPGNKRTCNPDAIVAWTTYDPQNPPPADVRADQIPVLVVEVKPARKANTYEEFMEAEDQILKYLTRINDRRTAAHATARQALHDILTPGLLIIGTRCFRYRQHPPDADGNTFTCEDSYNDQVINYWDSASAANQQFFQWIFDIRSQFTSTRPNPPDNFHELWFTHDVYYFLHYVPNYEPSLYSLVYDALDAAGFETFVHAYLVRPQAGLREPVPMVEANLQTPRTSYDFYGEKDIVAIPDFIVTVPAGVFQQARLIVEVKKEDNHKEPR